MATVKARGDLIALISGNQIKVHDVRKGTNYILNLPESPNDAKDSQNNSAVNSTENSPTKKPVIIRILNRERKIRKTTNLKKRVLGQMWI